MSTHDDRPALPESITRDIAVDDVHVYAIPLTTRFRGITVREGLVFRGPAGWGEFCPFAEYDDAVAASWLATAVEAATLGWPAPVRERIPINVTVPVVTPERAHAIVTGSGCLTAKVKVADHADSLAEDLARLEAVRDALGPDGAIRIDVNGAWDVDTAASWLPALDRAAGGLEYVEQPCPTLEDLAALRRRTTVPVAADEAIRRAPDPLAAARSLIRLGAADIAIIKCTPLGGVRRALRIAEATGLPCVVSSALETSVGMAAQLALAGALPALDHACGLGTLRLLTGDLVAPGDSLVPRDGHLPVPRTPPAPDPALLEHHAHPDADRVRWWTDRLGRATRLERASRPLG